MFRVNVWWLVDGFWLQLEVNKPDKLGLYKINTTIPVSSSMTSEFSAWVPPRPSRRPSEASAWRRWECRTLSKWQRLDGEEPITKYNNQLGWRRCKKFLEHSSVASPLNYYNLSVGILDNRSSGLWVWQQGKGYLHQVWERSHLRRRLWRGVGCRQKWRWKVSSSMKFAQNHPKSPTCIIWEVGSLWGCLFWFATGWHSVRHFQW